MRNIRTPVCADSPRCHCWIGRPRGTLREWEQAEGATGLHRSLTQPEEVRRLQEPAEEASRKHLLLRVSVEKGSQSIHSIKVMRLCTEAVMRNRCVLRLCRPSLSCYNFEALDVARNGQNSNVWPPCSGAGISPHSPPLSVSDAYDFRAMEELSVRFNKLEIIPEGVGNSMPYLRVLDVGLNKLNRLPKSLGNLANLQTLDVHFNMIRQVPATLGRLSNLKTLNLSNNFSDLTEVPASLADLASLLDLDLSNNQIEELPLEFGRLTQLQKLSLQGNNMKEPPVDLVAQNNTQLITQHMAARLKNHSPQRKSHTWTDWLAELLGGDLDSFGKWLNGLMAISTKQLEGTSANALRSMELTNVQQTPAVDLEAQAHIESLLPVSGLPLKALKSL